MTKAVQGYLNKLSLPHHAGENPDGHNYVVLDASPKVDEHVTDHLRDLGYVLKSVTSKRLLYFVQDSGSGGGEE